MTKPQSSICHWTEDGDGMWWTQCGEAFEFLSGDPSTAGAKYCLFCGGGLVEVAFIDEEEEDTMRTHNEGLRNDVIQAEREATHWQEVAQIIAIWSRSRSQLEMAHDLYRQATRSLQHGHDYRRYADAARMVETAGRTVGDIVDESLAWISEIRDQRARLAESEDDDG